MPRQISRPSQVRGIICSSSMSPLLTYWYRVPASDYVLYYYPPGL